MTILVTGGAGFIGSNFIRRWIGAGRGPVVNLDLLTYAGRLENLRDLAGDQHIFVQGSIGDRALVSTLLKQHAVTAIVHFAAESHVDRSIGGAAPFIETNVVGTYQLLEAARYYFAGMTDARARFRFLHVSTDEVYGSLEPDEAPFTEDRPYRPNSPYAASKAASDHWVRAYAQTHGLPTLTTNCSNNYGPRQYPEKLIPVVIARALAGEPIPVYGDGQQVRDWLYVDDHCAAIEAVLTRGAVGRTYNIGGSCEKSNLELVNRICAMLDEVKPRSDGRTYAVQIAHVQDRLGHDRRYGIDSGRIQTELGWMPAMSFDDGLKATIHWYLQNQDWALSTR